MAAKKGVHSLNYLVKTKHTGFSFLIVIRFIFTHFIVVPTAGTCIKDALTRRSRLGYVYRMPCCICSKTTIFALTQRVRPAFLAGNLLLSPYRGVLRCRNTPTWPKTDSLQKPPKEKGQTPMTSVCPFQEKRIVNMAIVALPIQVMILVSLVRLLFYAVRKCCQH